MPTPVAVGDTFTIRTGRHDDSDDRNCLVMSDEHPVKWATSDPSVISVNSSGLVRAHAPGPATIAVEHQKAGTAIPYIVVPEFSTLAIDPATAILLIGDSTRLRIVARDSTGRAVHGVVATWSIIDSRHAISDSSGATMRWVAAASSVPVGARDTGHVLVFARTRWARAAADIMVIPER